MPAVTRSCVLYGLMLIGGKPHWHTEPLRMAYGASIVWGRSRSGNQAARNCRQITWQRDNSARRYMKLCAVWTNANRWQAALATKRLETEHKF